MKIFLVILFLSGHSFAQELSPADVLERVRTRYSQMNDMSADFVQTVKVRYKQSGQKTSGHAYLKKGNKYRIETDQQTIVTNGKKIWMYSSNTKQVLVDVYKTNRQSFSPDKFLAGLPKDFSATKLEKENDLFILTLEPMKTSSVSSLMTGIRVWVHSNSRLIERVEYSDKNGTATSIAFSHIAFNKGIADTIFQFDISSDMKVIDVNSFKQ